MKKISFLEKKLNVSAFAFVVAMAATSYSHAHGAHHHGNATYVGLDAVYNWMGFKQDYGQNIFKKQAPGLNVFVGHMFHQNFGAELGFEWDKKVKKDVTIAANEKVAGSIVSTTASQVYKTKIDQTHPYLGVLAKTHLMNNTSISLLVGASLSNIKAKYDLSTPSVATRTFKKTKLIPLVRLAVEHKISDKFGIRGLVAWKNTSAFKVKSQETPSTTTEIKLKDTFNVGFGVAYYLG